MFVKAIELAAGYTWPVIISVRRLSGRVETEVGTLVVVNPEGWFVTAAHLLSANQQGAIATVTSPTPPTFGRSAL
jgi:hypothetical protein